MAARSASIVLVAWRRGIERRSLTGDLSLSCVRPGAGHVTATSSNMKLVHWPLMGGLLHLVQRGEDWTGPQPAQALLAVPNVIAHPSTASVLITVFSYNDPLLCDFNVPLKG